MSLIHNLFAYLTNNLNKYNNNILSKIFLDIYLNQNQNNKLCVHITQTFSLTNPPKTK